MRSNGITHRIVIAIFALALLSFFGIGCGGGDDDDDDDVVMDDPTNQPPGDEPPDDQLPGDQPPDDQPPGDEPPADQPPDDEPAEPLVTYAADVQPIFTANCAFGGCHAANAPSGLTLTSYANFANGGNRGPAFVAGNSGNSLVINRLEGRGGARMPIGGGPLRDEDIQKIKDWIDYGGKDN